MVGFRDIRYKWARQGRRRASELQYLFVFLNGRVRELTHSVSSSSFASSLSLMFVILTFTLPVVMCHFFCHVACVVWYALFVTYDVCYVLYGKNDFSKKYQYSKNDSIRNIVQREQLK